MAKISNRKLRTRLLPAVAISLAVAAILASYSATLQSPNEGFGFGVYWPAPNGYLSSSLAPNIYLGINYTGPGVRYFAFTIATNTTIIARGNVSVNHLSPFTVVAFAPVPSNLHATVTTGGKIVFSQDLQLA